VTRLDSLREELDDLARLLDATSQSGAVEWSPEWMARQTMLRRQADLAHEMSLLEGTSEFEVRLIGGAERGHEVAADFLGTFLTQLQLTVASIVQSLTHGETERGPLPGDVLTASMLRVGAAAPGSFVVQLSGPPDRALQTRIDATDELPPFDEAMDRVLDVLQAIEGDTDIERLQQAIADVRSPRAMNHVEEFAKELARTGTTAVLTERSPFAAEPRQARVTATAADRLQQVLSRTTSETTRVFETGQLSGLRWTRGIFDLEVQYGEETVVISGRVSADIRAAADAMFDKVVRAELERTVVRSEYADTTKETYLLIGVTPVEG
jgi:hypothetical protein